MTTLFSSYAPVKTSRTFGRGIHAYSPDHSRVAYTQADLDWLLADDLAREEAMIVAELEDMVAEAIAREEVMADLERQANEAAYYDAFNRY